jgi:hypothetical protein
MPSHCPNLVDLRGRRDDTCAQFSGAAAKCAAHRVGKTPCKHAEGKCRRDLAPSHTCFDEDLRHVGTHPAFFSTLHAFRAWSSARPKLPPKYRWPTACRNIWYVGNSVSRIHYFATLALLRGDGVMTSIDEQIAQCGRGGEWRGARPGQGTSCLGPCSCASNVSVNDEGHPYNVHTVGFVWQQRLFDDALPSLLAGSFTQVPIRPGDLVVLNAGLDDLVHTAKRHHAHVPTQLTQCTDLSSAFHLRTLPTDG